MAARFIPAGPGLPERTKGKANQVNFKAHFQGELQDR